MNKFAPSDAKHLLSGPEATEFARRFAFNLRDDGTIEVAAFDPETHTAKFAAVGNDGWRPVVWGLGTTPEMAYVDALQQEGVDAGFLQILPCTSETQERVQMGDMSWP